MNFRNPVPECKPINPPILYKIEAFRHNVDLEISIMKESEKPKAIKKLPPIELNQNLSLEKFENLSVNSIDHKKELSSIFSSPSALQTTPVPSSTTLSNSPLPELPKTTSVANLIANKIAATKGESQLSYVPIAQNLLDMGFEESLILKALQSCSTLDEAVNYLLK
eukprot:NODE_324_length_9702_cov_1.027491.p7 type:complete len:166 gc:universal NODE_324_length_9702_cov_1.027491:1239-1736(+)